MNHVNEQKVQRLLTLRLNGNYLRESSIFLIDHLHDSYHNSGRQENRHAEDRSRLVSSDLIHGSVEPRICVGVSDVQELSSFGNVTCYSGPYGEPENRGC